MRKTRLIENYRCYHLMSRLYPPAARLLAQRGAMRGAHRAFFLDDDEKLRAVELLRRVEELTLQFPSQPLLPYADDGEGADQADGSRPSAVAATEVSPGMSYSINTTLLTISDLSISPPNDIGAMAMRCVESHQQGFDAKILSAFTFATRQERPSYLNVYKRGLAEIEALLKGNQII